VIEYAGEAIVLHSEPNGDLDARFSLFTRQFGKLVAKGRSARKITSKLSSHLQPGNLVRVRVVEKSGLQVVDALKERRIELSPSHLHFLNRLLGEGEPDLRLWRSVLEGGAWSELLKLLGWDPLEATCYRCGRDNPDRFHVPGQDFFCKSCGSNLPKSDVICIDLPRGKES